MPQEGMHHQDPRRAGTEAQVNEWTPEHDTQLRDLHARELSVRDIGEEMGFSKSTIQRHAATLGLEFNRAQTAAAAQAVSIDNKARRAVLAARFLTEADRALDKLEQPYVMTLGSAEGPKSIDLDRPDAGAYRNYMTAAAVAADKHVALEKVDADGGRSQATSMLERLLELGVPTVAAATLPATEPDATE